jgi:pyruvate dehydrogenase E1 component beta subunit
MMSRTLTYVEAIREALDQSMERDKSVFVMGLGSTYKDGCDGTTAGLVDKYSGRVFDTPCSENATTGFCVGAAIAGMRPVIYHGRVEFALFAMDQIVTQAAKWNYMFGGKSPVPVVIRIAVGRRWGDAPQHTSVLHSLFAHVPGLKVVIPSTPRMAKGLLTAAIEDNNPVIFMEHRWLYGIKETVPEKYYTIPLDSCRVIRPGKDITIVVNSDTLYEALKAVQTLKIHGIDPEIIDLVSINPVDYKTIFESVRKTRRLMVLDVGTKAFGIGSEIISRVCEDKEIYWSLAATPVNIAAADCPCPMAPSLTEKYYPTFSTILDRIGKMEGFRKIESRNKKPYDFYKIHMPADDNLDEML